MKGEDLLVYGGLAYLGYSKLPEILDPTIRLLWGPIGLKLATTQTSDSGIGFEVLGTGFKLPVNSQVAGLSMLAVLGFTCLPWGKSLSVGEQLEETKPLIDRINQLCNHDWNSEDIWSVAEALRARFVAALTGYVSEEDYKSLIAEMKAFVNAHPIDLERLPGYGGAR